MIKNITLSLYTYVRIANLKVKNFVKIELDNERCTHICINFHKIINLGLSSWK